MNLLFSAVLVCLFTLNRPLSLSFSHKHTHTRTFILLDRSVELGQTDSMCCSSRLKMCLDARDCIGASAFTCNICTYTLIRVVFREPLFSFVDYASNRTHNIGPFLQNRKNVVCLKASRIE